MMAQSNVVALVISVFIYSAAQAAPGKGLLESRIWKMSSHKRAVFLDSGIFHTGRAPRDPSKVGPIVEMRNNYDEKKGYERLVFELGGEEVPFVYGKVSESGKILHLDIRNARLEKSFTPLKRTKFFSHVDLYTFGDQFVSTELHFERELSFDVFYLTSPTRLVIDIRP